MRSVILASAILAALFGANAMAQSKSRGAGPIWLQTPFDTSVDSVGRNFQGHECKRIASALKALNLVKDEYETTGAFNARLEAAADATLYGGVTTSGTLALVRRSRLEPSVKYDADSRTLTVNANIGGLRRFIGQASYTTDSLEISRVKKSGYVGSNAFGTSVHVDKSVSESCYIAFERPSHDIRNPLLIDVVDYPAEKARALKSKLDVVYVGRLTQPFVGDYFNHMAATIDSPSEITSTGDALVVDLDEVWVVDKSSGEVLAKKRVK